MERKKPGGSRAGAPPTGLDLQPHPERVSESYADERIREKIGMYASDRPREGLRHVSERMKEAGMPAAFRLHYITAVAHLGRLSEQSLDARLGRGGESRGFDGLIGPETGP